MFGGNTTTFQIGGEWIDKSGKIWRSSQSGNTFNWLQCGTGRVASGIVVPLDHGLSQWIVFATFDGQKHYKLIPSNNGSQLTSSIDTFSKLPNNFIPQMSPPTMNNIPPLNGFNYQDLKGMIWGCILHEGGRFVLRNLTDGRLCDSYITFDIFRNTFILYMAFLMNGVETIYRTETADLSNIPLPGDCFRRIGVNNQQQPFVVSPQPQPVQQPPVQQPQQPVVTPQPQPKTRYFRIGGGKDGSTTWTRYNGAPSNSVVEGWEMVFEVDPNGNVSGSNKNDTKNALTKFYSGTFKNNVFDVTAKWNDGGVAVYKGSLTGNKVRLDFVMNAIGKNQGGKVGDYGINSGTLFETTAPPFQPKSYNFSGKTYWRRYNAAISNAIVDGWEMAFKVDSYGNISGSNKNAGQSFAKTYSGTLINNVMEAEARWDDGRVATYKGVIVNNSIKLDFVIAAIGSQRGCVGDSGLNTGILIN